MQPPGASIVIPTLNGGDTLGQVVEAVERQRFDDPVEVVVLDSGSTDGSIERFEGRVDRLIRIEPGDFNHGVTRNLGVQAARADLVVLLVQDAVPQGDDWLARLTAPLRQDSRIAGAFARQVPRPDASRVTREYHARWVAASETTFVSSLEDARELERLTPVERHARCAFDNVCSCIRRSVWKRHPFGETPIAEDVRWARDVLQAGHRIAFAADAVVAHSHERSVMYELRRTRATHEQLFTLFGLQQVPDPVTLVSAVASSMVRHAWWQAVSPARLPRALGLAVAWPLGQYLGARDARRRGAS